MKKGLVREMIERAARRAVTAGGAGAVLTGDDMAQWAGASALLLEFAARTWWERRGRQWWERRKARKQ